MSNTSQDKSVLERIEERLNDLVQNSEAEAERKRKAFDDQLRNQIRRRAGFGVSVDSVFPELSNNKKRGA